MEIGVNEIGRTGGKQAINERRAGMTDTDHNPQADQTRSTYQPVAFTSDAPTVWRPKPNRAQRREIERRQAFYRRMEKRFQQNVTGAGIPWQTIAAAVDRTPENEAAERAIRSLHAQDAAKLSGAAGSVKK